MVALLKHLKNEAGFNEVLASLGGNGTTFDDLVPFDKLSLLLVLGFIRGFDSECEIEYETRMDPLYRDFCGYSSTDAIPTGALISYSRRLFQQDSSYSAKLESLLNIVADFFPNLKIIDPHEYLARLDENSKLIMNPPNSVPFYLYKHQDSFGNNCVRCSGGCAFYERNQSLDNRRVYSCSFTFGEDYIPSTLRSGTKERPAFPLGKVLGTRECFALNAGDSDGGLRTKGIYKKDTAELPLITYVTVVYNRAGVIQRCMESIWAQSYSNVEYIVVDGGSTDGTLEYIKENEDKIDYFVSQPDNGLYDAMNKGVALASGRFVCMMNSDDWCTPNAAKIVAERYIETGADLVSGLVIFNNDGKFYPLNRNYKTYLFPNNTLCYPSYYHQGLYASRKAFETVGYFDLNYYPVSDCKWTILCVNNRLSFDFTDEHLAIYTIGNGTATTDDRGIAEKKYVALTNEMFPFLSKKQAKTLHYTLFCSTILHRELLPCFEVLKAHLKTNASFRVTAYRLALYTNFRTVRNMSFDERRLPYYKYQQLGNKFSNQIDKKCSSFSGILSLEMLQHRFCEFLEESLKNGDSDVVSWDELQELGRLVSLFNKYHRKYIFHLAPRHSKMIVFLKQQIKRIIFSNSVLSREYTRRWILKYRK